MEQAIERLVLTSECRNSIRVFARAKWQALVARTYCVGSHVLDEPLTRLPDLFRYSGCKTIKSEKKIRVVRMPLRIGQTIRPVYVKEHNTLFLHQMVSFFCPSAALRSLRGAAMFLRQGFATARPIAAVEYRRWGILIKSFYVTEEITGAKTVADYWREDLLHLGRGEGRVRRRAVLRKLACLLKSLHEKKIYHNDLKAANILARQEGAGGEVELSFIDLQGVRKCFYVSKRRRIKNLAQINRTLGNHLTRTEKLSFLKAYSGDHIVERRKIRRLVQGILEETSRQIIRERSRHPCAEDDRLLDALSGAGALGKNGCAFSTPD